MKNLPQASMLGTKMRSATEECEQRARRECGLGRHGWRGASKNAVMFSVSRSRGRSRNISNRGRSSNELLQMR